MSENSSKKNNLDKNKSKKTIFKVDTSIKKNIDKPEIDFNQYLKDIKIDLQKNINFYLKEDNYKETTKVLKKIKNMYEKQNNKTKNVLDLGLLTNENQKDRNKNTKYIGEEDKSKVVTSSKPQSNMVFNQTNNSLIINKNDKLKPLINDGEDMDRFFQATEKTSSNIKKERKTSSNKNNSIIEERYGHSPQRIFEIDKTKKLLREKERENIYDKPQLIECPKEIKKKIDKIKPIYLRYKEVVVKKQAKLQKLKNSLQEISHNLDSYPNLREFSQNNNQNKTRDFIMQTDVNDKKSRKKKFDDWIERNSNWENSKNHKLYALREQKENELLENFKPVIITSNSQMLNIELHEKDLLERQITFTNKKVEKFVKLSKKYDFNFEPKINKQLPTYMNKVVSKVGSLTTLFSKSMILNKIKNEEKKSVNLNKSIEISKFVGLSRNPKKIMKLSSELEKVNHNQFVSMFERSENFNISWKNIKENKILFNQKHMNILKNLDKVHKKQEDNDFLLTEFII